MIRRQEIVDKKAQTESIKRRLNTFIPLPKFAILNMCYVITYNCVPIFYDGTTKQPIIPTRDQLKKHFSWKQPGVTLYELDVLSAEGEMVHIWARQYY